MQQAPFNNFTCPLSDFDKRQERELNWLRIEEDEIDGWRERASAAVSHIILQSISKSNVRGKAAIRALVVEVRVGGRGGGKAEGEIEEEKTQRHAPSVVPFSSLSLPVLHLLIHAQQQHSPYSP